MQHRKIQTPRATSEVLEETVGNHKADDISLGELMRILQERGFGLLMVVLVLPNCVPIPVPPGVSTIFSVPLVFLAAQMLVGHPVPWLPNWLRAKTIKRATLATMVAKLSPKLKIVEKLLKPRLTFFDSNAGERVIGFFWMIFAISIAVPLPMTNFLPGIGILFMSLGLLSRDGLVIFLGIIIGLLGCAFTVGVLAVGVKALETFLASFATIDIPENF
ncbi:MAG: exopolysaccharide biosynthesis protein [Alphaproteobacteria bacterium]|nr:exopolysaccharide biosynthesis protein [Alphaproteobacteria bacterium]